MTARFARRLDAMKASEIRELLKITQRPSSSGTMPSSSAGTSTKRGR